jgi:predicted nucleotidyltransferase
MASKKKKALASVNKFLRAVQKKGIRIDRVFIFGSQVSANTHKYSDIDLAIISKNFKGNKVLDAKPLDELIWDIDARIEPFAFRPEDFNDDDPLASQIIKFGMEIPVP